MNCLKCGRPTKYGAEYCDPCMDKMIEVEINLSCHNSPRYEKLPNRCLNDQRLANIACQFCSSSMYHPEKGFTCEV